MEAQEYNFKLGELVLYRFSEVWRIAIWGSVETHERSGNIRDGIEVIPLEGNEYLHGTHKDVKPKRWRAEQYGQYYCICSDGSVTVSEDDYATVDNARFKIGNYFKTEQEAKESAQKFINLLKCK